MSVTLDANVLVYAIDATAGRRHEQASAIVERWLLCQEGVIILQTMAEFYAVTTRKLGTPSWHVPSSKVCARSLPSASWTSAISTG